MKTCVFFVEGETEAVFVRHMLELSFPGRVDIKINNLGAQFNISSRKRLSDRKCQDPEIKSEIYICPGDGGVIPALASNWTGLSQRGVSITCLRDIYPHKQAKQADGLVDRSVVDKYITSMRETINKVTGDSDIVDIKFAVMEIEAWFLSMTDALVGLSNSLTLDKVKSVCDINKVDPESIYKPSKAIKSIFELAGRPNGYDKSISCIETMVSLIERVHLDSLYASPVSKSYNEFADRFLEVVCED